MKNSSFGSLYSHVRSLGVDNFGKPVSTEFHLIGQEKAREALSTAVGIVKENRLGGRMIVINGPPACGKTSAAIAVSKELGERIPFTFMTGEEIQHENNKVHTIQRLGETNKIYNQCEQSRAEIIEQAVRKSVLVRIREIKDTYEGEVVEIEQNSLTLRSRKGTITLKNVPAEEVSLGDVVYIEGKILKKIGRCETRYRQNDLDALKSVPLPKGEVHRRREKINYLTLHDLDHFYSDRLRKEVDGIVGRYLEKGMAEIYLGVLFIKNAHILDKYCLSYLGKISECVSPLIILSSTQKLCECNVLSRGLLVKMESLEEKNIREILEARMKEEDYKTEVEDLVEVSQKYGLRYAISLIRIMKTMHAKNAKEAMELFSSPF